MVIKWHLLGVLVFEAVSANFARSKKKHISLIGFDYIDTKAD